MLKPSVTVSRTNPIIDVAIGEIKKSIADEGFMVVSEYLECRDSFSLTDEILLPELQRAGYGFVKTTAANPDLPQEVIVDLRFIAASMLVIYSDPKYALHQSVLKTVHLLHRVAGSNETVLVSALNPLIQDTYEAYGHHFSYMSMADAAVIEENQTEEEILIPYSFADRHKPALSELLKNEEELTAVYHLCVNTMLLVNNGQSDVKLPRTYRNNQPAKAYEYFWKSALKIMDRFRHEMKTGLGNSCSIPGCSHQHQ